MKEINQLVHFTKNIESLKSILQNGLYTSYSLEVFCEKNQLIPMISFSNVLYRDIGENEVIKYGDYGISISRDIGMSKYGLNPVLYVAENSEIEKSIQYNIQESALPQAFHLIKDFSISTKGCCGHAMDNIKIKPLSREMEIILRSIDEGTSQELLDAYKTVFSNIFLSSIKKMLLIKSYKVKDKNNKEWIAYNEREWRKSFFDLPYYQEYNPTGDKNEKYEQFIKKSKPHFTDKYILKIDSEDIQNIIVKNENEKEIIKKFILSEKLSKNTSNIFTLNELKEKQ